MCFGTVLSYCTTAPSANFESLKISLSLKKIAPSQMSYIYQTVYAPVASVVIKYKIDNHFNFQQ